MKNIVIIGAGPAGLTAGLELLRKSNSEYNVTVLEASERVGGISATVNCSGNRMDLGGHRFFSKDERVNEWWSSLLKLQGAPSFDDKLLHRKKALSENGPDPEAEDNVMLLRQRVSRIYYLEKFFDYPVSLKAQTLINLGFVRTMKAGFSYLHSIMFKKDESSLENFYINRFGKELYSMFFEGYTEKLWGRHPSEISADWGAQRVKGISIKEVLKNALSKGKKSDETSLIEEFKYPKFGPGQLWETAAAELENLGGKIIFNAEVNRINVENGKITSVTAGDKEYSGDIFISSMPIKDLVNSFEQSLVSNEVKDIANGLPYRDFVTVGLLVNRLEIKNKTDMKTVSNIVPDCWIYVQDDSVKLGRIQIFNNWSSYLVKDVENTVWLGLEYFCTEGDDFWNMSESACVDFAVTELKKIGVISNDTDILLSHREKVKKAYPAYFDTYDELPTVIDYLNSYENLYCIGRNGQHRYNNMDHSMMTAFEAVNNILTGKMDKSDIWNVNTEKEYHEKGQCNG